MLTMVPTPSFARRGDSTLGAESRRIEDAPRFFVRIQVHAGYEIDSTGGQTAAHADITAPEVEHCAGVGPRTQLSSKPRRWAVEERVEPVLEGVDGCRTDSEQRHK
jgi:hypothetical protein